MKKSIIIGISLFFLFILLLIGYAQFSNFALFDTQCKKGGCSGEVCYSSFLKIDKSSFVTTCEFKPEYGCYKDCKVRSFQCGFDQDYASECLDCIKKCKEIREQYTKENLSEYIIEFDTCSNTCYN